ncbi:hypothetical protein SAMN05216359_103452 [Roseateles sp. YR242]|nr:hypothetical protein SAMN05216359_103452 [Roseateles sp. YR242]
MSVEHAVVNRHLLLLQLGDRLRALRYAAQRVEIQRYFRQSSLENLPSGSTCFFS